ncbi:rhodanese-like domain-containing protein [Streptomyces sp. NPDC046909]|uniref:rhodanese-like domain-containing protein n=1 Tax=Streptomyces sp. NPDC046909 TaxID=3155617 RepID=UPI0033EF5FCD
MSRIFQEEKKMTTTTTSKVLRVRPADPAEALAHFRGRLAFEADVSDVHADLGGGEKGFVLIDTRSTESWEQGHIPGAVHLPTDQIAERAAEVVPAGSVVVTYCWGPGCNGATRAAYAFAELGYRVKEMLGGFEYWSREGFEVEDTDGLRRQAIDPLTAPVSGISCAC